MFRSEATLHRSLNTDAKVQILFASCHFPSQLSQRALPGGNGMISQRAQAPNSKIPTGTLPLAPHSVSIKFNGTMCLIFLTTTLHNWSWQYISLKNLKHFIFLYNIVHWLNIKHLVDSFKIPISLTAISVTTHLVTYIHVIHTSNNFLFISRHASMHTHTHSCKSPFPEPKGQDLVSKGTYFVAVFKNKD